jgi:putative N6-adenine-specific DNA methylase
VTCRRSRLYHSDAVAERVQRVIAARLGGVPSRGAPSESEPSPAEPRVFVRIVRDRVQVSIDASGERLHRRGYRVDVVRAPLRETLAAALGMLLEQKSGGVSSPVWDPFCGSGTLLLEWLALSRGIAPGGRRRFAFERWPVHDAGAYARWLAEQSARPSPSDGSADVTAYGSDVSERAISAAVRNADRAGLGGACRWWAQDFRQAAVQIPTGTRILTNPPYGVRMARGKTRELYAALDELLSRRSDLRPVVLLCGDAEYVGRSQLGWRVELTFKSGGLAVRALSLGN